MGVVYSISFVGSKRRYIGSATNLRTRLNAHLHRLRCGNHHSILLQRAAEKYGLDNLIVETLEADIGSVDLIAREQAWIDRFVGHLYNRAPVAGSRLGLMMPDEAKAKISASLKGNKHRLGIPHDERTKAKIATSLRRAYAEGRHAPTNAPKNLAAFNAAIASGDRTHPRVDPKRDVEIAKSYERTKLLKVTAAEFGIGMDTCSHAIRRAGGVVKRTVFTRRKS